MQKIEFYVLRQCLQENLKANTASIEYSLIQFLKRRSCDGVNGKSYKLVVAFLKYFFATNVQ